MSPNKMIAVAILNWNGRKWLEKFLPNVLMYSDKAQVYIIDNASTDDSVAFVEEKFPSVVIIQNGQNLGFTGGYNQGLKHIQEEVYCLLNSDVEVSENWLEPIISLFEKDKSIAVIQPKILAYHRKTHFEFAGAGGGLIDNLGFPYCRGRVFDTIEQDIGQYNDEVPIFWASGCCFFIRKEDFWAVKGFDELFFAHQEEIDLCWRLHNLGRKVFYTGKSTIYHVGGGTLNKQNPRKTFLNIRNNLLMLVKNLPIVSIFWVLPVRLLLDFFVALYFGYREGWSHIWAVFRAHMSFYYNFFGILKKRKSFHKKDYYNGTWLVFRHYLKMGNPKDYSEIK